MASVRDWAVAKLSDQRFEGDADALAAYVDALAENNTEHENGDLATLKAEASAELADFLGPEGAVTFVADLVTHIAKTRGVSLGADTTSPAPAPTATPAAAQQAAGPQEAAASKQAAASNQAAAVNQAAALKQTAASKQAAVAKQTAAPAPPSGRERSRLDRERERPPRSRGRERERDRERVRDRSRERERGRDRDRDRDSRPSARSGRPRDTERPSVMDRLASDARDRDRIPSSRRGAGAPIDLREQLNRRRNASGAGTSPPGPQKRPRDDSARMTTPQKQPRFEKGRLQQPQASALPSLPGVPIVPGVPNVPSVPNVPTAPGVPGVPPPPPGAPPGFPFGILPPQMMMAMSNAATGRPGAPPPDPALLAMFAAAAVRGASAQNSRGRGGRGGRPERNGTTNGGSSHRGTSSTLVVRNVPEDKLNFGDLNNYFQKFGSLSNIRLLPPGRAFLEFANRREAQAAMSSVDAVFGNRHVKLNWAREQDLSEGAPVGRNSGRHSKNNGQSVRGGAETNGSGPAPGPTEDPEAQLKRKRQEIQLARAEEERKKEERKSAFEAALAERTNLLKTLNDEASSLSMKDKVKILNRMKAISAVLTEDPAKPSAKPAPPAEKPEQDRAWKRQRVFPKHKSYTLDNRPKIVRIAGAKEGISPDAAAAIFRDTERAEMHEGSWILHFSTRAAAESALRAVFVLKRGFGPAARAEIIKHSPAAQPFVPTGATAAAPPGAAAPVAHPQSLPGTQ